jgi:hypothetical protein
VSGRNGILWNGHPIGSGSTIILLDGDIIEIKGPDVHRSISIRASTVVISIDIRNLAEFRCFHLPRTDNRSAQIPNKSHAAIQSAAEHFEVKSAPL